MSDSTVFRVRVDGRPRDLGGFSVTRVLPAMGCRAVGPFVFLDEMGPAVFAAGKGIDVRPHPHIGLSTVSFLFEGEIVHRDSLGVKKSITPGAVNLMTAGRGVTHSERSSEAARAAGQRLHGLQFWVALRQEHEDDAPGFWHYPASEIPKGEVAPGVEATVVVGEAAAMRSPVAHPSEPLLVIFDMAPGAVMVLPARPLELALTVVDGAVEVNGEALAPHTLGVLYDDREVTVRACEPSRVALFGGPHLDGPRFIEWNFVATTQARIEAAKTRWRAREFAPVPGDEVEFIPLPEAGPQTGH